MANLLLFIFSVSDALLYFCELTLSTNGFTFPFEYTCVFELRMNQFQYLEIEKLLGVSVRRAEFMVHRIQKKIRKEFTINM